MLEVSAVSVAYGQHRALSDAALSVGRGEIVVILGANGAGKTSLMKAIAGIVPCLPGKRVTLSGGDLSRLPAHEIVEAGLASVPEGRGIFGELTVAENLLLGANPKRARDSEAARRKQVLSLFPRLNERLSQTVRTMSGGEQQMVAIGRALMSKPKMVLLDEPSMGLAPQLVEEIFEIVKRLNEEQGVSVLLAEQNTNMALRYASYGYILENGRVVMDGDSKSLRENEDVKEFYLGVGGTDRKSFRDVKSYKRRKRWLA